MSLSIFALAACRGSEPDYPDDPDEVTATITLTPAVVTISDNNLEATVTVAGTATGIVTLNAAALPDEITVAVSGATITVTGERPTAQGAYIDDSFGIVVTRGGVNATLTVNADLTTAWSAPPTQPTVAQATAGFDIFAPVDATFNVSLNDAVWQGLEFEGKAVDANDFSFDSATGVLTIYAEFLETLSLGNAVFTIVTSLNNLTVTVVIADATPRQLRLMSIR